MGTAHRAASPSGAAKPTTGTGMSSGARARGRSRRTRRVRSTVQRVHSNGRAVADALAEARCRPTARAHDPHQRIGAILAAGRHAPQVSGRVRKGSNICTYPHLVSMTIVHIPDADNPAIVPHDAKKWSGNFKNHSHAKGGPPRRPSVDAGSHPRRTASSDALTRYSGLSPHTADDRSIIARLSPTADRRVVDRRSTRACGESFGFHSHCDPRYQVGERP